MGGEFGQWKEWDYRDELEWYLLKENYHKNLQKMVSKLNYLYKNEKALYKWDEEKRGFEWMNEKDYERSILSFARYGDDEIIVAVCNFADTEYKNYQVAVPKEGKYIEIFNSQSSEFDGWDKNAKRVVNSVNKECCGKENSIFIDLPALGVLFFKYDKIIKKAINEGKST